MSDWRLVREYADKQSEAAFARLVDKHMKLVYWTCRRDTGDDQLAEDAAQAVFLLLAQKAKSLGRDVSIPGWLFRTARLVSRNVNRSEARRRRTEQEAAKSMEHSFSLTEELARIEPWLSDALASLSEADRTVVLLRYVEGLSLQEVAEEIGITDKAVSKRVGRATEKMRRMLGRKEVAVTSALLAAVLAEQSAKAMPPDAVHAVALQAIHGFAAGPAGWPAAGSQITALQKGVHFTMQAIRYKTLITAGAVIVVAAGVVVAPRAKLRAQAGALNMVDPKPIVHAVDPKLVVHAADGTDGSQLPFVLALERREANSAHLTFHWDGVETSSDKSDAEQDILKAVDTARQDALARAKKQGITDPSIIDKHVEDAARMTRAAMEGGGSVVSGAYDFVRDGGKLVVRNHVRVKQAQPPSTSVESSYIYLENDLCVSADTAGVTRFATNPDTVFPETLSGWAAYVPGNAARYDLTGIQSPYTDISPEDLSLLAGLNPLHTRGTIFRVESSTPDAVVLKAERSPIGNTVPFRVTLDPAHDYLPSTIEYSANGGRYATAYQTTGFTRSKTGWLCSQVTYSQKSDNFTRKCIWRLRSTSPSKPETLQLPAKVYIQDSRLLGAVDMGERNKALQADDPQVINYYWKGRLPSEDELRTMPQVGQQ